ncbi:MAG: lipid A deacylase LpxR family protein [Desulfurivibrio sp.]|nr:lipid A deacylase LpxR family protein [Desulfurivibrio sp.]
MNRIVCLALMLLLALVVFPSRGWPAAESGEALVLVLENDIFHNTDRHYTNGLQLSWISGGATAAPAWAVEISRLVPWFPAGSEIHHGYAFGQSIFTASDITIEQPAPDERPYAGWLYGSVGLGVESGRRLDLLALAVGMVGPASLAEQTQKFVHQLIGSPEPRGWDTQLGNEPGLIASYQRSWRGLATSTLAGRQLDFTPHLGAVLGNVYTYSRAGLTLRYGPRLPDDYGPPRIQPGLPGAGDFSPVADFSWYFFAALEGRVVARNIFLDGNTFKNSRSVSKKPLVGDLQFGVVIDWQKWRLNYAHVMRSKEFRGQDEHDNFGVVNISFKF